MTLLVAALGLVYMAQIQRHLDTLAREGMTRITLVGEMRDAVNAGAIAVRNLVLLTDEAEMENETQRIAAQKRTYEASSRKLAALMQSPVEKAAYARIAEAQALAGPVIERAMAFAFGNPIEATRVLIDEARPAHAHWLASLDALVALERRAAAEAVAAADAAYAQAQALMLAMTVFALAAGGLLGWRVMRSVSSRIGHAAHVAQTVASGDLTSRIEVDSQDEVGALKGALKQMNASLVAIVGRVRAGTETLSVASREIASGHADLSRRTESQAASLEETASSMEELTGTVRQNADNARLANRLVGTTSEIAVRGGQVVGEVVATMATIKASSNRIADITGVIDGIAFQTNILALNAAVEAARAGEQGRGFAVVASEVRSLAQRSASAAKEIKMLIEDSVSQVDAGGALVSEAGRTMGDIVAAVGRVAGIMGEIAEASAEQTAGIEQVNQAIAQMDEITQQNAALVEQATAATESLQHQAAELVDAVSVFRVEGMQSHASAPAAMPTPRRRAALKLVAPRRRSA